MCFLQLQNVCAIFLVLTLPKQSTVVLLQRKEKDERIICRLCVLYALQEKFPISLLSVCYLLKSNINDFLLGSTTETEFCVLSDFPGDLSFVFDSNSLFVLIFISISPWVLCRLMTPWGHHQSCPQRAQHPCESGPAKWMERYKPDMWHEWQVDSYFQ